MASFAYFDWETQSDQDLPIVGTLKYVLDLSTRPLLLSWCIDDKPVRLWCPDLEAELAPEVWAYVKGRMDYVQEAPGDVKDHAYRPDGYFVAWNAAFDRHVWQQVATPDFDFPKTVIEQYLCAMAQGQASNLPGQLDWAGRKLGIGTKTLGGKAVMKRFADRKLPLPGARSEIDAAPNRQAAVARAIEAWALYIDYSVQDTDLLRSVWRACRQLTAEEWQVYWTNEKINDRGIPFDLDVCRGAMAYREEETEHVARELARLTEGVITAPTLTKQINEWLFERLPESLAAVMVKARDEETDEVTRLTGSKTVIAQLIEDIQVADVPVDDDVIEVLELLQFGRSSSAVKFEKIVNSAVDGRVYGSFVTNGAGQTHRFASRGPQLHNAVHDFMPDELDVLDMIAAQVPIDRLRHLPLSKEPEDLKRAAAGRTPVGTVLARSVRPAIVAPKRKTFVWGDWAAIEARVMPWLAKSRAAEETVLDPYRNDEDIYILNASVIFKVPVEQIVEGLKRKDPIYVAMRQAGKIAQLSLQFGGANGAYKTMARGYKVRVTDEDTSIIVYGWRERNTWAKSYWRKCDDAVNEAMHAPMRVTHAGRLSFCFYPGLMGGSLVTFLPDTRPLVYPQARYDRMERFGKEADVLTYLNGMGRSITYGGKIGQNGCQAAAAAILRDTLVRLDMDEPEAKIIGHTHDEVLCEVDEARASAFAERLEAVMIEGFPWTAGLPLAAEVSTNYFYTKAKLA